jgi:hypothetical protein
MPDPTIEQLTAKHSLTENEVKRLRGKEEWRAVPGYEGLYEVSSFGNVRSLTRGWRNPRLVGRKHPTGYIYLSLTKNGVVRPARAHRLVLLAFIGPCPEGMEACHNDGVRDNNHFSNLRWDTKKANSRDRFKHGTDMEGARNGRAKLRDEDVRKIRSIRMTDKEWAAILGVSHQTIRNARKGTNWDHVNASTVNYGIGQKSTDNAPLILSSGALRNG